jgi:predicted dehydrogenase
MSLKIALVGCGKIADGHLEEIRKLATTARVVAVCDIEVLMAEQLAARFEVPRFYADFEQMLDREKPDVVHIATPPGAHLQLAKMSMDAGCHVYVEKPATPTHADTLELVQYAELRRRKLTVNYTYLFDPPALLMRELVAHGELGEPVHAESVYGYNLSGPFGAAILADPSHWVHRLPGKLFHNNIDHMLNKLIEFLPDESPTITACALVRRKERFGDVRDEMEDELRVNIVGREVTGIGVFSSNARPVGHYCRIFGTKNTMTVDYVSRTVTFDQYPKLPSAIGRLLTPFASSWEYLRAGGANVLRFAHHDFQFFAGLGELVRRFYTSIENETAPPIAYHDILRVSRMLENIWQNLAENRQLRAGLAGSAAARSA